MSLTRCCNESSQQIRFVSNAPNIFKLQVETEAHILHFTLVYLVVGVSRYLQKGVTWFRRVCPFMVISEIGMPTHELFRNSLEIVQFLNDFSWTKVMIFTNLGLKIYFFECIQDNIRNICWKTSQNQVGTDITYNFRLVLSVYLAL